MAEPESNPTSRRACARCGAELPANVPPDLCPRCLLQAALPTQAMPAGQMKTERMAEPPAPAPARGLPQPGDQLGHYRIVRLLGEGGMGAAFAADDLDNGRRIALKVLGQKLDSPAARGRFFREGRLAASINHPNSVYVFGTEEIGGIPVIAMELVSGGTLQERVQQRGPLPVGEAVDCVLQIIAGLEAARRLGILHRDIKPSNCFLNPDGAVKIGDFGLSISTTVRTEPAWTATGMFLGTPAFCSPEQLRGDELNLRSDMYSVGATLFYLLTGRTPFEGRNTVQLLAAALEKRAPSPAKLRPAVPPGLAAAVLHCLEKQPGDRFKDYHELELALAPYGTTAPTPATLGLRFLAGLIDQVFLSLIGGALLWLSGRDPVDFLNLAGKASPLALGMVLAFLATAILYYTLFEGRWGAAVGKGLCRLRVVGPNRSAPGFGRAFLRALIYVVAPMLPFWLTYGFNPHAYLAGPGTMQYILGLSPYVVITLLFCVARRRNGFAAMQDLAAKTRVVSRAALECRPELAAPELPPRAVEAGPAVGPYCVLETLEQAAGMQWLLGYDLRLLRKVWLRVVPPDTPPVPVPLRNLGRAGRLRWLAGRRSAGENWDAFEAPGGKPLLELAQARQSWSQVRYWLYDLAGEIAAAAKDGTLPSLSLDRVWIASDGRAKLLDFPAPGFACATTANQPPLHPCRHLAGVAVAALAGRADGTGEAAAPPALPLPLHARDFLNRLPQLPDAQAAAAALKPLLPRVAAVTRWRRAAIVSGCLAVPLFFGFSCLWGVAIVQRWSQSNPGLFELSTVLQQRAAIHSPWLKDKPHPTDQQYAVFIASHYRSVVTNETVWSGAFTMSLIRGEARQFAEQSIAAHPAPTPEEIKDADAAIKAPQDLARAYDFSKRPWFPLLMAVMVLVMYVCIPALIAALLFRGGLVLLVARVAFVRGDGARASRLRVFWRALLAWSPLLPALGLGVGLHVVMNAPLGLLFGLLFLGGPILLVGLVIVSVALPERGLPDRLAGTWPVPR